MKTIGLVPRNRLAHIPEHLRIRHEYSYFLHDEMLRLLVEYEAGQANFVKITFPNKRVGSRFAQLAKKANPLDAMRTMGFAAEAKRLVLNQVTLALTADFLLHIFEALRCLEKRKSVVAFNVLRKPLKDNLAYLCWILADPDDFYQAFASGSPKNLEQSKLGNRRRSLFQSALEKTELVGLIDAGSVHDLIYSRKRADGFEKFFQHAVHLITTMHVELETFPENFNFIFKSPAEDDIYELAYQQLPGLLLFSEHVIAAAFRAMHPGEEGGHKAASIRSILGFRLIEGINTDGVLAALRPIEREVKCPVCKVAAKVTPYNGLRMVLTESYRCASCKIKVDFPFSYIF